MLQSEYMQMFVQVVLLLLLLMKEIVEKTAANISCQANDYR